MDKRTFIVEFFNYLFRVKAIYNTKIIDFAEKMCHNNVSNDCMLNYFVSEMTKLIV